MKFAYHVEADLSARGYWVVVAGFVTLKSANDYAHWYAAEKRLDVRVIRT